MPNFEKNPLLYAVAENNLEAARSLLNSNNTDKKVITEGLYYTTSTDMAQLLLDAGAAVNGYGEGFSSPLHIAVNSDNYALCEIFLQNSADPNHRGETGDRPLHLAQQWSIANLLILYGADTNARNDIGATPLHSVLDPGVTKILLENGAEVNALDKDGCTPLYRLHKLWIQILDEGVTEIEPDSIEDQIATVLIGKGAIGACLSGEL